MPGEYYVSAAGRTLAQQPSSSIGLAHQEVKHGWSMGVPSLSLSLKKLVAHYARCETREEKVHPDQSNRFRHVKQKDTFGGLSDYRHLSQARLAQDQGHPQPSATLKNVCNPASSSDECPLPSLQLPQKKHTHTHTNISQLLRSRPSCTHFLFFGTRLFPQRKNVTQHCCLSIQRLSLSLSLSLARTQHSATPAVFFLSPSQAPKMQNSTNTSLPNLSLSLPLFFPCLDHNQLVTITGPPPHFTTLARIFVDTIPPTTSSSSSSSSFFPIPLKLCDQSIKLSPESKRTSRGLMSEKTTTTTTHENDDDGGGFRRLRRREQSAASRAVFRQQQRRGTSAPPSARTHQPAGRCPPGRPPFFCLQ